MGMVESLYVAFQPIENRLSFDKWFSFSIIPNESLYSWYPMPVYINNATPAEATNPYSTTDSTQNIFFLDIRRSTYFKYEPTITNFSLSLDTVRYIDKMDVNYYSSYFPSLLSAPKLATPGDPGIYFIPFNREIFTTTSGHINFSKFAEIKLDWTYSPFNTYKNSYNLIIAAKVLDFLMINENIVDLASNLF
jgi:hypothetical protein